MTLQSQIARYKQRTPQIAPLLETYERIFEIQAELATRIPVPPRLNEEEVSALIRRGDFVLRHAALEVDEDLLVSALTEISLAMAPLFGPEASFSNLLSQEEFRKPAVLVSRLLESRDESLSDLFLEKMALKTGLRQESIRSLVMESLVPFYQTQASAVGRYAKFSLWQRGTCPFCGHAPQMARLRRYGGARVLHCPLCRTEWDFLRLTCVSCGNADPAMLRYFFAGKDRVHRVDVCENCRTYMKSVDETYLEGDEVHFTLENLVTLNLDRAALREGYHAAGPGPGERDAPRTD
jgi:FdhE protein